MNGTEFGTTLQWLAKYKQGFLYFFLYFFSPISFSLFSFVRLGGIIPQSKGDSALALAWVSYIEEDFAPDFVGARICEHGAGIHLIQTNCKVQTIFQTSLIFGP